MYCMESISNNSANPIPHSDEQITMQIAQEKKRDSADNFQAMLEATKRRVRSSIIELLTNHRWGTIETQETLRIVKGKKLVKDSKGRERLVDNTIEIPRKRIVEGWIPNVPNAKGLMNLENSLEIADYVADQVDEIFSTTWTDPNVQTVNIAAMLAMIAAQKLDNPRYQFIGNETDSAAFALKAVSYIDAALNRSRGGFMVKVMGETTTNIYRRDIKEAQGDFANVKGKNAIEEIFRIGRQNSQQR